MTPKQLCSAFIENDSASEDLIRPGLFIRPAWGEYARRTGRRCRGCSCRPACASCSSAASLLVGLRDPGPRAAHRPVQPRAAGSADAPRAQRARAQQRLSPAASASWCWWPPTWTAARPRPSASRAGTMCRSRVAAAASAALPGLFPPVAIDGRWYVDGALKKTLHATVLLDMGLDLLFCLNPLVPFDATPFAAPPRAEQRRPAHPATGRRRAAGGAEPDLPQPDPFAAGTGPEGLRGAATRTPTSNSSSPTTATRRCSWPTPSAMRSAARWPSMPTSARAPICARGAARWR